MEFAPENAQELADFLKQEDFAGKKYVAYEEGAPILATWDIQCFSNETDALQFAHDNTSDFDTINTGLLSDALFQLKKTLNPEKETNLSPEGQKFINPVNDNIMNTQNLEYLQTNLKYFGFGDKLNEALEKNIKGEKAEFQLKVEIPHFNNKMDYTLHFKKSGLSDMYFFNRYDAALQNGKPEQDKMQGFYINKGSGITAKEAFNLLEGRSVFKDLVNKEGEKYHAWLKLDFENSDSHGNHKIKQFSEQYGYNLEKTLANFPIKELNDPEQKKQLLSSLEKGNAQQVTVSKDGKEAKYYIEAVPQFQNINVYDQKMHIRSEDRIFRILK